jgi:hypothetical protein
MTQLKYLTLVLVFLFTITLVLPMVNSINTYTNEYFGVSLTPPTGWNYDPETSYPDEAIFQGPIVPATGDQISFSILFQKTNQTLINYVLEIKGVLAEESSLTLASEKATSYAGLNCYELVYTASNASLEVKEIAIIFVQNTKAIIFLFTAATSNYDNYISTFQQSLQTLQITDTPPASVSISPPTLTFPSSWHLNASSGYPTLSISAHDPLGVGYLRYVNTKYDSISIYYEFNYDCYYSPTQLKNEATAMFELDLGNETIISNGTTTYAGVIAGYAKGYDASYNVYDLEIILIKNNCFVNIYTYYDTDTQTENEINGIINSLVIPTSPIITFGPPPTPTTTTGPTITPTTTTTPTITTGPTNTVPADTSPSPTVTPTTSSTRTTWIKCNPSTTVTMEGDEIIISGSIECSSGSLGPFPVVITIVKPDDTVDSKTTNTDKSGSYNIRYTLDKPGQWSFQSSWEGDSFYYGALSERKYVTASVSGTTQILSYILSAALVAVIIIILSIVFFKRRKKKPSNQLPTAINYDFNPNSPPKPTDSNTNPPHSIACSKCGKEKQAGELYCKNCGNSTN